jgi:ABC-type branched-subunit amino acid transport system substrate-binding protein
MSNIARELRTLRFNGAQLSILMDDTRMREAQGALDGSYFAMYPEASVDFQERFQKRYGTKPGITSDTAYDALKLYAEAIRQAKSFDAKVVGPIMQHIEMNGVSGHIVFDGKGGVKRNPKYYQVRSGKFVSIK